MQGEDAGWSGRGRVRGRRARVRSGEAGRLRGGGRPGPEAWALHPGIPRVPLPSSSFALARSGGTCSRRKKKKTSPQRRTSPPPRPRVRGQSQITVVPGSDKTGRKVSGPHPTKSSRAGRRTEAGREGDDLESRGQREGCASRARTGARCLGDASGGVRCPRCTGGGGRAAGADPGANTGWRRRGRELGTAVRGRQAPPTPPPPRHPGL